MLNLRAEKKSRNEDDFRVLLAGSVLCILFMLVAPLINQKYDQYFAHRPFIQASTLQIVDINGSDVPNILYDADAISTPMPATWIASAYSNNGTRLFSRRGEGNYKSNPDEAKLWTWFSFFDNEIGLPAPAFPTSAFYVCVRYIATAPSGVKDESDDFCSNIYTPKALRK